MTNIYTVTADVQDMGLTVEQAAEMLRPVLARHGWAVETTTASGAFNLDVPDHIRHEIEKALEG